MNLTNETNDMVQRDEPEMEDNETEEEESNEDESDPEAEDRRTFQAFLDNRFGRDLARQLERTFGSVSLTAVCRDIAYQARPAGYNPIEIPYGFRRYGIVA
jgi:hypothetical protein